MATFLKNINMVSRSATFYCDAEISKTAPIKGYHAKYLLSVFNNPGISQEALAKQLFVHKSNVARQIARLEEDGFVERREGADRRVSLVYITEKGREIVKTIRSINARWREVICEGFSEEEKKTLLSLTERLYLNAVKYMEGVSD